MSLFTNGQYKIFSVQFPGQDVDLLNGGPTSPIVGYHNNTDSHNMVWNLTNVGTLGNQFTLANDAPSAHSAYVGVLGSEITAGTPLFGSSVALTWTAVGTCTPGQYWVFAPSSTGSSAASGLIWTLGSPVDGTPILLEQFSNSVSHSLQSRQGGVGPSFSFSKFN